MGKLVGSSTCLCSSCNGRSQCYHLSTQGTGTFSPASSSAPEQDHNKNNHNRILASQCYRLFPQLKCSGFWSSNLETEITVFIFILSSLQKSSAGYLNQQRKMMHKNKSVFVALSPAFRTSVDKHKADLLFCKWTYNSSSSLHWAWLW